MRTERPERGAWKRALKLLGNAVLAAAAWNAILSVLYVAALKGRFSLALFLAFAATGGGFPLFLLLRRRDPVSVLQPLGKFLAFLLFSVVLFAGIPIGEALVRLRIVDGLSDDPAMGLPIVFYAAISFTAVFVGCVFASVAAWIRRRRRRGAEAG